MASCMPLISSHNPGKAIPGNLEWSGTLAEDFLPSEIIGSWPVPQRPGKHIKHSTSSPTRE